MTTMTQTGHSCEAPAVLSTRGDLWAQGIPGTTYNERSSNSPNNNDYTITHTTRINMAVVLALKEAEESLGGFDDIFDNADKQRKVRDMISAQVAESCSGDYTKNIVSWVGLMGYSREQTIALTLLATHNMTVDSSFASASLALLAHDYRNKMVGLSYESILFGLRHSLGSTYDVVKVWEKLGGSPADITPYASQFSSHVNQIIDHDIYIRLALDDQPRMNASDIFVKNDNMIDALITGISLYDMLWFKMYADSIIDRGVRSTFCPSVVGHVIGLLAGVSRDTDDYSLSATMTILGDDTELFSQALSVIG